MLQEGIARNSEYDGQKSGNVSLRDQLEALESLYGANNVETDVYYHNNDHLGSSSFITDANGIITQCLQYLLYGEQFVDQRTNQYSAKY